MLYMYSAVRSTKIVGSGGGGGGRGIQAQLLLAVPLKGGGGEGMLAPQLEFQLIHLATDLHNSV